MLVEPRVGLLETPPHWYSTTFLRPTHVFPHVPNLIQTNYFIVVNYDISGLPLELFDADKMEMQTLLKVHKRVS